MSSQENLTAGLMTSHTRVHEMKGRPTVTYENISWDQIM